jgi:hypothetical protein
MERGDHASVLAFARRLLARDSADPVGLWFAGMVLVNSPDPSVRENGIGLLRQSLASGIERVSPVPANLRPRLMGNGS